MARTLLKISDNGEDLPWSGERVRQNKKAPVFDEKKA